MIPEDDDFEFELEDDEEEEDDVDSTGGGKKKSSGKKAKMTAIPDGVKRKMALYLNQINKMKKEVKEYKDEKNSYEKELELLEDEIESIRSEKDKIEEDINKQIALANAYEKKLNRNQKDFDNFKKRTDSEVDRRIKQGSKKIILGIIDVIDNFDRALAEAEKVRNSESKMVMEGIGSIRKGLIKVLSDNNVNVVDPINEPFDPTYHEAYEMKEDKEVPDNTVIFVDSKGYLMGEMVLRPAKVIVSKGGKPRKKIKKKIATKDKDMEEIDEVEDMDEIEEILDEVEELEE